MKSATRKVFRIQLAVLIAGFVLLAAIVGSRSLLIERQNRDQAAIRKAFELERTLASALSLIQDAETGQRGYVLTGDVTYLDPYERAVRRLPAVFDEVDKGLAARDGMAEPFAALQSATTEKLAELQQVIERRSGGDFEGSLAMVRENRGKASMDRIRSIIGALRESEDRVLAQRLTEAERTGELLRVGSIAALGGIFALGFFGVWDARRRMRQIAETQDTLLAANARLTAEIDSRERAETQIRQMQKMEAVGQLTGGIAHDFNNMLAVIMSSLNLVQRRLARGEMGDVQKLIDSGVDAAERAARLTARLLAFSRQQPLAPSVVDANRLVAGMSDLLRRTLGETVRIETVLAGGLWRTHADTGQLENALINLCVNARDAMDADGRLTIETANCHLDDGYAADHVDVPAGQYVLVAVTDTGTGMPPEIAARVFDPFFTTKATGKGTGLGLSQVYGFVKQSGGHVKIYSEPGQGTTVKLYLPRWFGPDGVEETPGRASAETPASGKAMRILVVEDDDRVRAMTIAALREIGHEVVAVSSGANAIPHLEGDGRFDLLFTDIVMPGMTGRQLADEAARLRPDLKVLFTTGFTRNAVVHNGVLDHGVNFIAKPFTIEGLATKLREVLG